MAPKSRFFHASFSATLLRSGALAIALLVLASPARSETIDLACASTSEDGVAIRLLIDTDHSTVTEIRVGANGPFKSNPYTAKISDQFINYSGPLAGNSDYSFEGTLDRIAGTLNGTILPGPGKSYSSRQSFACRRATQKF